MSFNVVGVWLEPGSFTWKFTIVSTLAILLTLFISIIKFKSKYSFIQSDDSCYNNIVANRWYNGTPLKNKQQNSISHKGTKEKQLYKLKHLANWILSSSIYRWLKWIIFMSIFTKKIEHISFFNYFVKCLGLNWISFFNFLIF